MGELPECVDGLPNLCGSELRIEEAIVAGRERSVFLGRAPVDIAGIDSAFSVALHMHQPLIPAGGRGPAHRRHHQQPPVHAGAPRGGRQPQRAGVPLVLQAHGGAHPAAARPRADSRGHARLLRHACSTACGEMGLDDVFDALRAHHLRPRPTRRPSSGWAARGATRSPPPRRCRTIGCTCAPGSITSRRSSAWRRSGACAASPRRRWRCPTTPTSPTSSSRPSTTAATSWLLVQEHTVELPDGRIRCEQPAPAAPAGRAATRAGETAEIIAVIKTQGSDTKLVAQMQPYYEAKGLAPHAAGRQERPAARHADRRRRERRRDDERVPTQVPRGRARMLRHRGHRS